MTVIKRGRQDSVNQLQESLTRFILLLSNQKEEEEAVEFLQKCQQELESSTLGSKEQNETLKSIIDAFEGDLELIAYTFQRDGDQWTEVEELSSASSRVLSLARRMVR